VSPTAMSLIVLAAMLSGAALGALLRAALPEHHLSDDSRDIIRVGTGVVATLVALVLGLLIASAKTSFDTKSEEMQQGAAKLILLDRTLRRHGPAADEARLVLRRALSANLQQPMGQESLRDLGQESSVPSLEEVETRVRDLPATSESQRSLQARALGLLAEITQLRVLAGQQAESAISMPFLVVVVLWLAIIFGLLAPRNTTVAVVILLCAVAVSTAVLLILELDRPFEGFITLSRQPLQNALHQLER